jgi:Fe-S cluster biogenesis protein NfuA/nitrite reductase/ring-hydroxylating ferredoxin subunit
MSRTLPEQSVQPHGDDSAADLERMVNAITSLESIVAGWDEGHRLTVQALKLSIEELNREALKRLIRALKDEPAVFARMREVLNDRVVYGVLRFHGLVKEPLEARIQRALDEVRPFMHEHGGDVELVAIKRPDTVDIRLIGSCHGCPASSQTLTEGVEKAIHVHCPEIVHINQVSRGPEEGSKHKAAQKDGIAKVHLISPFESRAKAGWVDVASLEEVPESGVIERKVQSCSVILTRCGDRISCFDNRCAHLGMPLEMGEVRDGVITCLYHGFQYLLETGDCLTAPGVQLNRHAARVSGGRVQVRLEN